MSRIAVATADTLKKQMAGPAIRAWEIARALAADGHEVWLVTTSDCELESDEFAVKQVLTEAAARELDAWCEVLVYQGNVLDDYPFLQSGDTIVVVDLYDPFHLEQLEQTKEHDPDTRRRVLLDATAAANRQCLRGDFFLCASDKQRDFWLGHLTAVGRLNTLTYDSDETLRSLIAVVPFGISPTPPRRTAPAIKGVVPGIGAQDKVLLWGGGIYNWFDPLTLIRAVGVLAQTRDDIRLFFLGMQHPHPHVPEMRMSFAARQLADELGLTARSVFFNEQWVRYDERANYLLDADLGVSTHLDHVETSFSFRTRMLDYLWAGLPMVCTRGDVFAAIVEDRGLGITVAAQDVAGLAHAIAGMLDDDARRAAAVAGVAELAPRFHWDRALEPLVQWCRTPHRASDLLDPATVARFAHAAGMGTPPPTAPAGRLVRDLELAAEHLRNGGLRRLGVKAASRVRHRLAGRR